MKIHFAALLGVDYDMDLMPYWIPYYLDRKLDSYTIVLHREKGDIPAGIISDFKNAGFRTYCVNGPFNHGSVRRFHLNNIAHNFNPSDMLVTADADEFQSMPDGIPVLECEPIEYRIAAKHYDILHGLHEDRYADTLDNCITDPFIQYPYVENYTGEYNKVIINPFLSATTAPALWRTKILAAPAGMTVEYKGSHCVREVNTTDRILFGCRVIHFAWRESAARKLALKSYFSIESLKEVYGNKVPDDLIEKYRQVQLQDKPDEKTMRGEYVLQN
jgi:hypothetical protein